MNNRVLVTYATKYGATAEIAVKIGCVLRESGLDVEVIPIENVDDVSAYHAVVVGSAVYMGQWRREAVAFLRDQQSVLSERLVWLFSSGPTGEGDPNELLEGWTMPAGLQMIAAGIHSQDVAVFHGGLNLNKINMLEKWIVNRVKAPIGDYRDWKMIAEWARKVSQEIKEAELVRE